MKFEKAGPELTNAVPQPTQPTADPQPPSPAAQPEQEDLYRDVDVLRYCLSSVEKKLTESRTNNFKSISLTYEELELIYKGTKAAVDRTDQLNKLAHHLRTRDTTMVASLSNFQTQVTELQQKLNAMSAGLGNTQTLAKFFLSNKQ